MQLGFCDLLPKLISPLACAMIREGFHASAWICYLEQVKIFSTSYAYYDEGSKLTA